jgi:hypothetical protein
MSVCETGVDPFTRLNRAEILIVMPLKRRRFAGLRPPLDSANSALALELGERVLGDAQFEKNFVGVLSQTRGVPINRRRRAFEADGGRHVLHGSEPRVFVGHDTLPMYGLGVHQEIVERIHRCKRRSF